MNKSSKNVKVIGTQKFINATTGELEEMQVTSIEERDFNFSKIWMRSFIATLDIVGNQKTRVCFWIIDHIDRNNMLIGTQRFISEESGASLQTVNTTLNILLDADFLRKVQTGVYLVNPDIVFKGDHQRRLNVLNQYSQSERVPMSDEDKLANLLQSIQSLQKQAEKLQKKLEQNKHTDGDGNEYPKTMEDMVS